MNLPVCWQVWVVLADPGDGRLTVGGIGGKAARAMARHARSNVGVQNQPSLAILTRSLAAPLVGPLRMPLTGHAI
jgi:hypothetical protein